MRASVGRLGRFASLALATLSACGNQVTFVDKPPTVTVEGRTYGVSVVRAIVVHPADLEPYARIQIAADATWFLDAQTFALPHVDPQTFLLVRAKPGLRDDTGPLGDYIGLFAGEDPDLCAYFTELGPTWCKVEPAS
jgi:hypothetical protein